MILFPPAKINLGLNVLSKRNDGYHEIETCMVEIALCDVLEVQKADRFEFKSSGLKIIGGEDTNLCVKAFRLLENKHNLTPVYIHLRKNIPMGAGLGGGSSDGTYVLLALNELFDLKLSDSQLESYAAELGSDCPFFVKGMSQLAKGRGEILESITVDLSHKYIKLINPQIHIGTAEAYGNVKLGSSRSVREALDQSIGNWQTSLDNGFEEYAFAEHPELITIREQMIGEGAVYSAMSGSGSTMFGIYNEKPDVNTDYEFERVFKM